MPPVSRCTQQPSCPSWLTPHVHTPDLAALVPALMSAHPACEWTILTGTVPSEDLEVTVCPASAPDRKATIRVLAGAEVFTVTFAGHVSTDYAYNDAERPDTLQERIEFAVAASTGPTRVTLERAGTALIGSTLVLDPDGSSPRHDARVSWPIRRLQAALRGRSIVREVLDFPEAPKV